MLGFCLDNALLNLSLLCLLQPSLDVLDSLIIGPVLEFLFSKVQNLPALVLENLGAQFLHLGGSLGTLTWCVLLEVEVDSDFLVIENVV